jgi:hypothetical protein
MSGKNRRKILTIFKRRAPAAIISINGVQRAAIPITAAP